MVTDWNVRIAIAFCTSARWLSGTSLALTLCAFVLAALDPLAGRYTLVTLALVVALGAAQIYFAVRIEFDRVIFEAAEVQPDRWAGFDKALTTLLPTHGGAAQRTSEDRLAGLVSLVKWSGGLLVAQFILALAALTIVT